MSTTNNKDEHLYCHICRVQLKATDINPYDFFLACQWHKEESQKQAEVFFKTNPNYIQWQNIEPDMDCE